MEHHPTHCLSPASAAIPASPDCATSAPPSQNSFRRPRRTAGLTLVEVMVSLTLMSTVMLAFISTFLQSRRFSESSVLQSASTSMIYGLIEQMKGLDYTTLVPSYETDSFAPSGKTPPYIRLRIHQDLTLWLMVVHTRSTDSPNTPKAPLTCPAVTATAASVGAIDNFTGNIPLSTVTGTASQDLALNLWVWIDEIPDTSKDVSDVKRITVVYTYSYLDGSVTKTVRDMEVFIRTRYDQ
jgi:type II secretory pathway pseudopilin PulG